jgi:hypothetical protein
LLEQGRATLLNFLHALPPDPGRKQFPHEAIGSFTDLSPDALEVDCKPEMFERVSPGARMSRSECHQRQTALLVQRQTALLVQFHPSHFHPTNVFTLRKRAESVPPVGVFIHRALSCIGT